MLVFFSNPVLWEHICILNVRLGGETDQQNIIMHKAYHRKAANDKLRMTTQKDLLQRLITKQLGTREVENAAKSLFRLRKDHGDVGFVNYFMEKKDQEDESLPHETTGN